MRYIRGTSFNVKCMSFLWNVWFLCIRFLFKSFVVLCLNHWSCILQLTFYKKINEYTIQKSQPWSGGGWGGGGFCPRLPTTGLSPYPSNTTPTPAQCPSPIFIKPVLTGIWTLQSECIKMVKESWLGLKVKPSFRPTPESKAKIGIGVSYRGLLSGSCGDHGVV